MRGVLLPVALIFSVFVSACSFGEGEEGKTDSKGAQQALLVRVTRPEVRSMERRLPMTAKMTPLLEGEVGPEKRSHFSIQESFSEADGNRVRITP